MLFIISANSLSVRLDNGKQSIKRNIFTMYVARLNAARLLDA